MSLLSDLLSKIKHPEMSKEVPPGLKSAVSAFKKKESNKKRLAILIIFATVALGSGFLTVYLAEVYLNRPQKIEYRTQNTEYRERNIIEQAEPRTPSQQPSKASDVMRTKEVSSAPLAVESQKKKGEMLKIRQSDRKEEADRKVKAEKVETDSIDKSKQVPKEPEVFEGISADKSKAPHRSSEAEEKDLYLYIAQGHESRKDYPNALTSYKKVLGIEPRNYRVMNNIASILIQLNSYEEARAYLQMTLGIRNDYVPGLINMGIVLARLGEIRNAESNLLRAITLDPDNRHAILNIAILYEKEGNYEKAREYYSRLKQLGDVQGGLGLERIKGRSGGK